jgi:hypothetical protein
LARWEERWKWASIQRNVMSWPSQERNNQLWIVTPYMVTN